MRARRKRSKGLGNEGEQARGKEKALSLSISPSFSHLGRRVGHVNLAEDGVAVVGEHDAWDLV